MGLSVKPFRSSRGEDVKRKVAWNHSFIITYHLFRPLTHSFARPNYSLSPPPSSSTDDDDRRQTTTMMMMMMTSYLIHRLRPVSVSLSLSQQGERFHGMLAATRQTHRTLDQALE
jgi:hypothetical protein